MDRVDAYRLVAPFIAGATLVVASKAINSGYRSITGSQPPRAEDLEVSTSRVVAFAILTAAVSAVINVGIQRSVALAGARNMRENVGDIVNA